MTPSPKQIKRWQQYLANERAEAVVYRELARNREGAERDILMQIAHAEMRHEQYWREKLGDDVGLPRTPDLKTRLLAFLASRFGTVFVLAMLQTAEARNPYEHDEDATEQIKADEAVHAEVVRGLATQARQNISGNFRAAVFGANDGLVSNLALVLGVLGSGVSLQFVLLAGVSGLLAGALSMAAGEYISVKSANELTEASVPRDDAQNVIPFLDVDANELALVYRARGMDEAEAEALAQQRLEEFHESEGHFFTGGETYEAEDLGSAWGAAASSFIFFASGALIPLLPFIVFSSAVVAGISAVVLVSFALMCTGAITGILSGKPPLARAMRQLIIGLGAAVVTYALGAAFGVALA
ncbi:VIT1/CCC1 transporter family protein [Corynebacterium sp. HS2168-gen11]|uniref:VIT1/CCC1 transporter family protein n=1 Tax=Corynebacterium sp. HS2168-gen11 TaxID=2974027 RepID=UPI00216B1A1D|nr:VIT1/CCC1 transporter family protein [Corynebacterium sp. HS2168-gen11]MCS4535406.1 VIT1/CCC1 transporter family protein [Corynebacterium sp. HS2168-gen11]